MKRGLTVQFEYAAALMMVLIASSLHEISAFCYSSSAAPYLLPVLNEINTTMVTQAAANSDFSDIAKNCLQNIKDDFDRDWSITLADPKTTLLPCLSTLGTCLPIEAIWCTVNSIVLHHANVRAVDHGDVEGRDFLMNQCLPNISNAFSANLPPDCLDKKTNPLSCKDIQSRISASSARSSVQSINANMSLMGSLVVLLLSTLLPEDQVQNSQAKQENTKDRVSSKLFRREQQLKQQSQEPTKKFTPKGR